MGGDPGTRADLLASHLLWVPRAAMARGWASPPTVWFPPSILYGAYALMNNKNAYGITCMMDMSACTNFYKVVNIIQEYVS